MMATPSGQYIQFGLKQQFMSYMLSIKKSKRGIATPNQEIDLVRRRLKAAEQHYRDTYGER